MKLAWLVVMALVACSKKPSEPAGGSGGGGGGGGSGSGSGSAVVAAPDARVVAIAPPSDVAAPPEDAAPAEDATAPTKGRPAEIVLQLDDNDFSAMDFVVDEQAIYWSTNWHNKLRRHPLAAGPSFEKDVEIADMFIGGIAIDKTTIYWLDSEKQQVMAAPKTGGKARVLGKFAEKTPRGFLLAGDRLFWQAVKNPTAIRLASMSTKGGPIATIAESVFGGSVASDGKHVYFNDLNQYALFRAPVAGGKLERVASIADKALTEGMALDATHVYWADWNNDGVFRVEQAGGTPQQIATSTMPYYVALVGDAVYFSDPRMPTATVQKTGKQGGPAEIIIGDGKADQGLYHVGEYLYFGDGKAKAIKRLKL